MDMPPDAITISGVDSDGGGSTVVLSADTANPVTIFTIDHLNEGGGVSTLGCSLGLPLSYMPFNGIDHKRDVRYVCTSDVTLDAVGVGASAGVSITYAPYNYATVVGGVVDPSQDWIVIQQWTYGDVATVALLILISAFSIWRATIEAFRKPVRYHK